MTALKIAFICGKYSTGLHGRIDAERLFEARALTGSESSFFNAARGLAELGHQVTVYCDVEKPLDYCERLAGAAVHHIDNDPGTDFDAYVSLNEPDQFRRLPSSVKGVRIVQQQLNDFPYAMEGFDDYVDIYAFLAPVHRDHVVRVTPPINRAKAWWIPNSINLEISKRFLGMKKKKASMAWCSSPDRGLHRLLEMWPLILRELPEATLKIFYRFEPWYQQFKDHPSPIGARARFIGECLDRLGRNGENGVTLVGPIPNIQLAQELAQTEILPYTCDCITFTEGFSVSIMDACAAGAVPVIADTDAIGDIYRNIAVVLPPNPGEHQERWAKEIARISNEASYRRILVQRCQKFAQRFGRINVAHMWEILIKDNLQNKKSPVFNLPASVADYAVPIGDPRFGFEFPEREMVEGEAVIKDIDNNIDTTAALEPAPESKPVQAPIRDEHKAVRQVSTSQEDFDFIVIEDGAAPHIIEDAKNKGFKYFGALYRKPKAPKEKPTTKIPVTVLLGSNRPGGIDIALHSLRNQTYKDFEVIFVDGMYHERWREVRHAVKLSALKQPFFHVPNIRYNPRNRIWGTACAGFNTGLMLAAGKRVVMLLDYGYARPNWLEAHMKHHQDDTNNVVLGPHEYRSLKGVTTRELVGVQNQPAMLTDFKSLILTQDLPHEKVIELICEQKKRFHPISIFQKPFDGNIDSFPPEDWQEVKTRMGFGETTDYNLFNTKNESFNLETALAINGIDENFDRGSGPGDPGMGLRLQRMGAKFYIEPEATVYCLNPRRILPNSNLVLQHDKPLPPPYEERWPALQGMQYHEAVVQDPDSIIAPNPYRLDEKREEIWWWREESVKPEPNLPFNVLSDREYFGE